jgi:hypothetical protein
MERLNLKKLKEVDGKEKYRVEVSTRFAVEINAEKNGVFWVITPCGSCKNRRFGGTWRLLHQGDKNR